MDPCMGLAFSNTGSIGIRVDSQTKVPSAWRVSGLPRIFTIQQFVTWLSTNGWPPVDVATVRRRVAGGSAVFILRGVNPGGVNVATTVEATTSDGTTLYLEFE
eukprot:5290265-Pyramimonas_sp.AAC.1